jgi:hypothetical protein
VQAHAVPGERQQPPAGLAVDERGGLHGRVEQGGVDAVGGVAGLLGQRDLAEVLIAPAPHRFQALEDRSVAGAVLGECGVEAVDVHCGRTGRWPLPRSGRDRRRTGVQDAHGVLGPLAVVRVGGPGVHADLAPPAVVRRADEHLDRDAGPLVQRQRRGQGQLGDPVAADLVGGAQHEFEEPGGGEQDHAADGVVGEPGLGVETEPAGEHGTAAVGERDRGAEQRMPRRGLAETGRVGAVRTSARPVAGAFERLRRQVHRRHVGEEVAPRHGNPGDVQGGERAEDRGLLRLVAAQHRHGQRLRQSVGQGLGDRRAQRRVRAQLDEPGDPGVGERADRVGEPDRFPHLPHPVPVGVEPRVRRDGGDHGDVGGLHGDARDRGGEVGEHRVHERRVERVAHVEPGAAVAQRRQLGHGLGHPVLGAGQHHRVGPVDRGDRDALTQQRQHGLLGGAHGDHRAPGGQRGHQPGTRGHERARVGQRQHPGDVRGGDLADRVADEQVRPHAPGLEQPEQRHLQREQRGLRPPGVPRVAVGRHLQLRDDRVVRRRERGIPRVQLAAHAQPLRALPGEHERDPPVTDDSAGDLDGVAVPGEQHRAVLQRGPLGGERQPGPHGVQRRGGGEHLVPLGRQPARGPRGQHPRHGVGLARSARR